MTVIAPVYDKADAKTDVIYPYHLPDSPEWSERKDWYGSTALMGSGMGMFLKNPLVSWVCFIFAVVSFVQYQPLRKAKDAQSPLMSLGIGALGVMTINIPKLIISPAPSQT